MTEDAKKVQQVLTWILEGNSEHLIRETIASEWPNAEATPLILAAMATVNDSARMTHDEVENWCFEATRFLYAKCVEIGEFAQAMRAVKQMQEISARRTKQEPAASTVNHHHTIELGPVTAENIDQHKRNLSGRIARLGHVT